MIEKIKIVLKEKAQTEEPKIKLAQKQIEPYSNAQNKIKLVQKKTAPDEIHSIPVSDDSEFSIIDEEISSNEYLQSFFIDPLNELIQNDGVHEGFLIAQTEALQIMQTMFDSLLIKDGLSVVDILKEAAFAGSDCEQEQELVEEDKYDEEDEEDEDYEDYEEQEEDDDEVEDDEISDEYDYEYDIEEARECEDYMEDYDESMDG